MITDQRPDSSRARKLVDRYAFRIRHFILIVILCLFAAAFLMKEDILAVFITEHEGTIKIKDDSTDSPLENDKTVKTSTNKNDDSSMYDDALERLKSSMDDAMNVLEASQKEQYGEFADVFKKDNILKYFRSPSDESAKRLKLRLKTKVLKALFSPDGEVQFNWVVGGHSAAAGHGNLLSQSYAGVIERTLQPVFQQFNVSMYGKNYAMGGTSSGPEIAMCMESIFGTDVDAITWDYGMLDGNDFFWYSLFVQRAGVHPTKPSVFLYRKDKHEMDNINAVVEQAGLAVFRFESNSIAEEHFPDTDTHPNIDELPPGVKFFVCNGHVEAKEPCVIQPQKSSKKWDTVTKCPSPPVGYQVNWHSGWKSHMFIGFLQASYLVANLDDAITELSNDIEAIVSASEEEEISIGRVAKNYLDNLLTLEEQDKEMFKNSSLPQDFRSKAITEMGEENYGVFQRSSSYCHTARLPSQSRYDGLVTENGIVSSYIAYGRTTYKDEGYTQDTIPNPDKDDDTTLPWLVYDKKTRQICEHAEIDFKDAFQIRNVDNWMTMYVPNNAESEKFMQVDDEVKGYVMFCTKYYDFHRYPPTYAHLIDLFNTTEVSVEVNGVAASDFLDLGNLCFVLKNEDGYIFPPPKDKNQKGYEIKVHVPIEGQTLYLSSVVVL